MVRFQFEDDAAPTTGLERVSHYAQTVVRGGGFVLLIVGLWIALAVISEAWSLYRNPQQILRLADAIEQGSNLDHTLAKASQGLPISNGDEHGDDSTIPSGHSAASQNPQANFRLSYFVAWVVAILLLMLIGRLAIAAVKTGGELVLYDLHIKRFVRELLREAGAKPPR